MEIPAISVRYGHTQHLNSLGNDFLNRIWKKGNYLFGCLIVGKATEFHISPRRKEFFF